MHSAKRLMRFLRIAVLTAVVTPAASAQQAEKRAITFEDQVRMRRVSEAQVSRDGKWVAYTLTTPNLEANRNERHANTLQD